MPDRNQLYPVIMAVPAAVSGLRRAERQRALSRFAREPLTVSADKAGLTLPAPLEKDRRGAPLPSGGLWWSVTHKPEFAGGIVSTEKTGIDIEKIVPFSPALMKKIVSPEEARLFDGDAPMTLFRCWTAKEVVLKATGRGLGGLSRCRVEAVVSPATLAVSFDCYLWSVEQRFFSGHLAAVAKKEDDCVFWTLLDADGKEIPLDSLKD
jgi:4'-phosphopantetheinyl transferase